MYCDDKRIEFGDGDEDVQIKWVGGASPKSFDVKWHGDEGGGDATSECIIDGDAMLFSPSHTMIFGNDDGEVGRLEWKDGKLEFTGDADESATQFVCEVIGKYEKNDEEAHVETPPQEQSATLSILPGDAMCGVFMTVEENDKRNKELSELRAMGYATENRERGFLDKIAQLEQPASARGVFITDEKEVGELRQRVVELEKHIKTLAIPEILIPGKVLKRD